MKTEQLLVFTYNFILLSTEYQIDQTKYNNDDAYSFYDCVHDMMYIYISLWLTQYFASELKERFTVHINCYDDYNSNM